MNLPTSSDEDELLSNINTTPLVDVMLVLLIIFLITIPVTVHTIPIELPKDINHATKMKPIDVNISVTKNGFIYWNRDRIMSTSMLQTKMLSIANLQPQPVVNIWGDQLTHYQRIGEVLFACQRAGIRKVGFITEPPAAETN